MVVLWSILALTCTATFPILAKSAATPKAASSSKNAQQTAQSHYLRGERLEEQGDIAGAIKEYKLALKLKPTSTATKRAIDRLQKKKAEGSDPKSEGDTSSNKDWPPSETELSDLVEKGCYGTEQDRQKANAVFLRVLGDDIVEPVQYIYFPVTGSTRSDVVTSYRNGASQRGFLEWGYTKSDWLEQPSPGKGVQLSLRTTITLPQWTSDQGTSPDLISKWTSFYNALAFHEQGHALIFEYGVAVMRLRLNQAPTLAIASAICSKEAAEMQSLSDEYDQRTQHGVLQGANF